MRIAGLWFAGALLIVLLCLTAGCTGILLGKTANLSASGSPPGPDNNGNTGNGGGSAGSSGAGSGETGNAGNGLSEISGNNGNSGSGSASQSRVDFTLTCNLKDVHDSGEHTDTTTVKLNGDIPITTDQDAITLASKTPYLMQYDNNGNGGDGTKLFINVQWDHVCNPGEQDCTSCHYVYNGPVMVSAMLRHESGHAPNEWSAWFNDVGTYSALNDNNQLDRYSTVKGGSDCNTPGIRSLITTNAVTQTGNCWGTDFQPVVYGDGSAITFTSADPEITLDSKAVFHFGVPP